MEQFVIRSFEEFKLYLIKENVAEAKEILQKHNLDTTDSRFREIMGFLQKGKELNLAGEYIRRAIEDGESVEELKDDFEEYKKSKRENTPYQPKEKKKGFLHKYHIDASDKRYKTIMKFLEEGKAPGLAEQFVKWCVKDGESIASLEEAFQQWNELKEKNVPFPPIHEFKEKSLEEFTDAIFHAQKEQVLKQTFKNIPVEVKRYLNKKIEDLITNNPKYAKQIIGFLGNKGRAFHSSEELYNAIVRKLEEFSKGWNMEEYVNYIQNNFTPKDVSIIYQSPDERVLVLDVKTYAASEKMGNDGIASTSWCITRGRGQWDNYVTRGLTKQYYVYDFSKSLGDPLGKIATTIGKNGNITEARDSRDYTIPNHLKYFEDELGL